MYKNFSDEVWKKLHGLARRHEELERLLAETQQPDMATFALWSREYMQLTPVKEAMFVFQGLQKEYEDLQELLAEDSGADAEMRSLAREDEYRVLQSLETKALELRKLLLPQDADDVRNAIMEVRAGTGGEEAALFAADLLRMYKRYAESKGWTVDLLSSHESDYGGVKEAVFLISGSRVFSRMKFEAGVHRVQRVPDTEASGRIHTSAATVAVLPEMEEVDIHIEEKDLRIDVFRASGPGGQCVNTTDSAVRITHIPSGLVVQQQDEKSQHKNKAKALKILRSRLYEYEQEKKNQERSLSRQTQVGRGDRSERIRTYNFPQGRITDHRVKLTLHKLSEIMEGGDAMDEIIDALHEADQLEQLSQTTAEA